jgi:hypothetical protein
MYVCVIYNRGSVFSNLVVARACMPKNAIVGPKTTVCFGGARVTCAHCGEMVVCGLLVSGRVGSGDNDDIHGVGRGNRGAKMKERAG